MESDSEEVESPLLQRRGLSDLVELRQLGSLGTNKVFHDGGQILEQGAQAMHGQIIVSSAFCRDPVQGTG